MTAAGWVLMAASWAVIFFWTGWCFYRVLTSRRHWQNPEEDIAHLEHGEFAPPGGARPPPPHK